jgi:imidazolonepropionase-like amidohydrolase
MNAPGRTRAAVLCALLVAAAAAASAREDQILILGNPGKLADLILIDGDPSAQIADINKVTLVMKGGRIYDPARIEQALGIAPRNRS